MKIALGIFLVGIYIALKTLIFIKVFQSFLYAFFFFMNKMKRH